MKPQWFVGFFVVLGIIIIVLALGSNQRVGERIPAQSAHQADVGEQRITLADGRTVLCLTFNNPRAVVCDWASARYTAN